MALFLTKGRAERAAPRIRLWPRSSTAGAAYPLVRTTVDCLSVGVFLLIIAAGVLGTDSPTGNFAPLTVWVIWWVGMAFVSALVGNLWRAINPWDILFRWFEACLGRLLPGRKLVGRWRYPSWLGVWPAAALFVVFAWLELLWVGRTEPAALARVILAYSLVTWAGMFVFGRKPWLEHGEVFTLVFSVFARFAPLAATPGDRSPGLLLRPYGVGLLTETPVPASLMVLVLAMLSTVAFDGFVETPTWFKILEQVMLNDVARSLLNALQLSPPDLIVVIKSFALVLFPLMFIATYLAFVAFVRLAARLGGGHRIGFGPVAGSLVLSLVPIALAYHLAHYFLFLLQTGQRIIPLVSDPFGFGWDLFGTAGYQLTIGIMNARSVWYLALVAIVLGHIFAVYVAHVMSLRLYRTPRAASCSQVPMVALMVAYTMTSLWILSQPVVA